MNSDYEALIEEHCENCYYNKNGVCNAARVDIECVYGNLKHDLQELDLLRKLQKEHVDTKKALEIIKEKEVDIFYIKMPKKQSLRKQKIKYQDLVSLFDLLCKMTVAITLILVGVTITLLFLEESFKKYYGIVHASLLVTISTTILWSVLKSYYKEELEKVNDRISTKTLKDIRKELKENKQ